MDARDRVLHLAGGIYSISLSHSFSTARKRVYIREGGRYPIHRMSACIYALESARESPFCRPIKFYDSNPSLGCRDYKREIDTACALARPDLTQQACDALHIIMIGHPWVVRRLNFDLKFFFFFTFDSLKNDGLKSRI